MGIILSELTQNEMEKLLLTILRGVLNIDQGCKILYLISILSERVFFLQNRGK